MSTRTPTLTLTLTLTLTPTCSSPRTNQRLLLECNGVKPLVSLAQEAPEPELQAQCMRALANLAVTPEYRASLLQARPCPSPSPLVPTRAWP